MSINIKPSHKGLLHKDLGVPAGKPIPLAKMKKAAATASPAVKKRIVFAENARKFHHDPPADGIKQHTSKDH